jgi:hypothetical protein
MRVTIDDIDVMYVVAEGGPSGAPAAFALIEAAIGNLQGRRFFSTYDGDEYRACVAVHDGDDPSALGLTTGRIPGGEYERTRLADWQNHIDEIGPTFDAMAAATEPDWSRPCIESYRSSNELLLLLPVKPAGA